MKKFLLLLVFLGGCATGPSPYDVELNAYRNYLLSEVGAGRMSREQGEYLFSAKRNEIRSNQSQAVNAAIGQAAMGVNMMNASSVRPIIPPAVNCQTVQQGYALNTRCQ